jgi:hypothetical protein
MAKQTGRWGRDAELKQLGDRVIPAPITIEMAGFDDRPDLELTFDVVEGQLQCRQIVLTARGDLEIQKRHVEAFSIDALRETVARNWSMPTTVNEDGAVVTLLDLPSTPAESREAGLNLQSTRRRTDPAHLERVAAVYLGADSAPTQAVADSFKVAHRTAGLYVQRAREAGLIPPANRGK